MGKAYSEYFDVTVDGNMLIRHNCDIDTVLMVAEDRDQFSVVRTDQTLDKPKFDISYPMRASDHKTFAALIHRANAQDKKKVDSKGGKPDNDPAPPTGGTPRGAFSMQWSRTEAIAA